MTEHLNPDDPVTAAKAPATPLITKEDIRFVDYWKEQRKGSRLKYHLLYSISWGMMVMLFSFFIIMFLGGISIIPIAQDNHKIIIIVAAGLLAGIVITFISWRLNERRYFRILDKVRRNMTG